MRKVITYGTYDLLHDGHIRLLERAKALGDYLIVGVTADDFDKMRGKINVQQPLMERIEAVKSLNIADEIIVEEYEGQKIDDIRKYDIDIFTVGSDWQGQFDYLSKYCTVIYLPRTEGVSSTEIREASVHIRLGIVGDSQFLNKVIKETRYVDGLEVVALCTSKRENIHENLREDIELVTPDFDSFLGKVDALYLRSLPENHYDHVLKALRRNKHVLVESPLALSCSQAEKLMKEAASRNLVLMETVKTAYSTAYSRLLLLLKGGKIGDVVSVDATCTSMRDWGQGLQAEWNGFHEWGPTALLPVLQILGTDYVDIRIVRRPAQPKGHDCFTKVDFVYPHAVASIKVGDGVKSEGDLVVTGTKGYLYVPAPWWKTDYFELRYENPADNKRFFYQLDGEGIRYELVAFARTIEGYAFNNSIEPKTTLQIAQIMDDYSHVRHTTFI